MNYFKKKILILIGFLIITLQNANAIKIINNKNFLFKIKGIIQYNQIFNKNTINNKILSTLELYAKSKKYNKINIFGKIKSLFKINNKENKLINNINTKIAYIGINNKKFGKITYGKNNENINKTLNFTNKIFPYNKSKILNNNNIIKNNNNILTYKKIFYFKKKNSIFKNITFLIQFKNNINKHIDNLLIFKNNGLGITYNISTKYGIDISTSYIKKIYNIYKINKYSNNFKYNKYIPLSETWSTAIKYNLYNLYLASSYTEGRNQSYFHNILNNNYIKNKYNLFNKNKNIILVAKYNLDCGLSPILGYVYTTTTYNKQNNKLNFNKSLNTEKYFDIGTTYKFNKSLYGFIDYKIDQLKNNKNIKFNEDNILSIGLIYKF